MSKDLSYTSELEKTNIFYVQNGGKAIIVCPKCGKAKSLLVDRLPGRKIFMKVKCGCKVIFKAKLEYRKSYRKSTNDPGTIVLDSDGENIIPVKVKDLSMGGLSFEIRTLVDLALDQKGSIYFTLGDKKKSKIIKRFTIRSVLDQRFGCEFENDKAYEKDLGYYMRL